MIFRQLLLHTAQSASIQQEIKAYDDTNVSEYYNNYVQMSITYPAINGHPWHCDNYYFRWVEIIDVGVSSDHVGYF